MKLELSLRARSLPQILTLINICLRGHVPGGAIVFSNRGIVLKLGRRTIAKGRTPDEFAACYAEWARTQSAQNSRPGTAAPQS
jgi:hypothetical protein